MANIVLTRSDLKLDYADKAKEVGDNPEIIAGRDKVELNRHESYEVLDFINKFAQTESQLIQSKEDCEKIEHLIRDYVPAELKKQTEIHDWLVSNFNEFDVNFELGFYSR
jgi:hypothetical protein